MTSVSKNGKLLLRDASESGTLNSKERRSDFGVLGVFPLEGAH